MIQVTVSPKYRVVIPKEIRKSLGIRPGQKFEVIEHRGLIELVPVRSISETRGSLPGIDTEIERERDRL